MPHAQCHAFLSVMLTPSALHELPAALRPRIPAAWRVLGCGVPTALCLLSALWPDLMRASPEYGEDRDFTRTFRGCRGTGQAPQEGIWGMASTCDSGSRSRRFLVCRGGNRTHGRECATKHIEGHDVAQLTRSLGTCSRGGRGCGEARGQGSRSMAWRVPP